ncbi:MAG: hypothetical protein J6L69_01485 [Lachnospiraceae bacterium]|nr:hypothetical protein [Lachnospiraceae bacterium]
MAIFTNQATLRYNGNVVNSNITTGEIVEVLSASKTAVVDTYTTGSQITYIINIVNAGTTAYTGITITDDLGEYDFGTEQLVPLDYVDGSVKYFVDGVLQPAPAVSVGAPLIISGITVPAGGEATIAYAVTANEFAPMSLEGEITNTAVISGEGITDITVSETVSAQAGARLSITKAVSPTTVAENGRITYTFTIQNTGNAPVVAADNATVTDTFTPILSDIVVTYNGTTWTEPTNYTYNETTGLFATVPGQITVPAATYTQDATTGEWVVEPGVSVLTVTGTI